MMNEQELARFKKSSRIMYYGYGLASGVAMYITFDLYGFGGFILVILGAFALSLSSLGRHYGKYAELHNV